MTKISKDHVENFGKVAISPYMCGEQPDETPAAVQSAAASTTIKGPNDTSWAEPSIVAPKRSMNTTVIQSKRGGNSIVINDEGADSKGAVVVVHRSGSVIQINEDGTVLIKSFGDTHNNTQGLHYQQSSGDTNMNVGGEWNVMIEGGSNNVYVRGDMNIECENYNLTARGKVAINAAEGIEMQGAKFSMYAHTDNIDMVGKNIKMASSEAISLTAKIDVIANAEENIKLKANQSVYAKGLEEVHLFAEAGGVYAEAKSDIHLKAAGGIFTKADGALESEGQKVSLKSGSDVHIKAGSGAYITGSGNVDLKAGSVNLDSIVYLASGKAKAASPDSGNVKATGSSSDADKGFVALDAEQGGVAFEAAAVAPVEFPAPPARGPRTDSADKVRTVQPRGQGMSEVDADDPS